MLLWQGYCAISFMTTPQPIYWLFILAIPIACIAWTVTHEEIFSEFRNYCKRQSITGKTPLHRKFFYLFTCEYCFSFYVTALWLLITRYQLLYTDWRGYLISGFSLIWIANIYMSLFLLIRTDLKNDGLDSKIKQSELDKCEEKKETFRTNLIPTIIK
jgi:hypothetical protein